MTAQPARDPVALITGAGSGIGRAAALMLAREGHRVALVGRDRSRLDRVAAEIGHSSVSTARAGLSMVVVADVGEADACAGMVAQAVRAWGRLDVVVSNAGWTPLTPIPEMDAATARRIFEVNALGPVWTTIAACRQFALQSPTGHPGRSPCIVNVSSRASTDPFAGLGVYGSAKAAVNTLSRAIATECPGVRSFAVAPGAVETPLLRSLFPREELPPERCLRPEDVARVILDCVLGAYDGQNGGTIVLESP